MIAAGGEGIAATGAMLSCGEGHYGEDPKCKVEGRLRENIGEEVCR
jgi:hypothetical protein